MVVASKKRETIRKILLHLKCNKQARSGPAREETRKLEAELLRYIKKAETKTKEGREGGRK